MKLLRPGKLIAVIEDMKESKEFLCTIANTAQASQIGIEAMLNCTMRPMLRNALHFQLAEYTSIERQALSLAASRGWDLPEVEPAAKAMIKAATRLRLAYGNTDTKIAAMMITGSTREMIAGLRQKHQFSSKDYQVSMLSQKLVDCQNAGIRQMQGFL